MILALLMAASSATMPSDPGFVDEEAEIRADAQAAAVEMAVLEMVERQKIADARLELCRKSAGQDGYPENVIDAVKRDPAQGPITDVITIYQAYLMGRIDQLGKEFVSAR